MTTITSGWGLPSSSSTQPAADHETGTEPRDTRRGQRPIRFIRSGVGYLNIDDQTGGHRLPAAVGADRSVLHNWRRDLLADLASRAVQSVRRRTLDDVPAGTVIGTHPSDLEIFVS
jgi:hypothetical protein